MSVYEDRYLPLNNLDDLDHRKSVTELDDLFPIHKDDLTLAEQHAGKDEAELRDLTVEHFYDGVHANQVSWRGIDHQAIRRKDINTNEDLVCGALRYVGARIREKHARPSSELQLVDRVQNAFYYLAEATPKYDPEVGVGFLSFIKPHLDTKIRVAEEGRSSDIHQGDLMRIPVNHTGYYGVKRLQNILESKYGRPFSPEETLDMGDFTEEQVSDYLDMVNVPEQFDPDQTYFDYSGYSEPTCDPVEDFIDSAPHNGLESVLSLLSSRERYVLLASEGIGDENELPKSHQEIGEELGGISGKGVSYIKAQALKKLRAVSNIREVVEGTEELPEEYSAHRYHENYRRFVGCLKDEEVSGEFLGDLSPADLTDGFRVLTDVESSFLIALYGLNGRRPMTYSEVGLESYYSKMGVSAVRARALKKLRAAGFLGSKPLDAEQEQDSRGLALAA